MSGEQSDLAAALDFYKREMVAANYAWFQAKIEALCSNTNLSNQQRMQALEPYFTTRGPPSTVTDPRQLLIPPGEPGYVEFGLYDDGTVPPASPETQSQYLQQLNQLLAQATTGDFVPPAEFAEFISMADAAAERDFRDAKAPSLGGTSWRLSRYSMADMQPDVRQWYDEGWHVVTGWQCGLQQGGTTAILYAQKHEGPEEDQELRWRVYAEDENENMYAGGKWFPSIAAYLRDRCQWFNRLPAGWEHQWKRPVDIDSDDEWVV